MDYEKGIGYLSIVWLNPMNGKEQEYGNERELVHDLVNRGFFMHDAGERMIEYGLTLDEAVTDYEDVREGAACSGYGLNVFANDECKRVRSAAEKYLERTGLTLEKWEEKYPGLVYDEEKER